MSKKRSRFKTLKIIVPINFIYFLSKKRSRFKTISRAIARMAKKLIFFFNKERRKRRSKFGLINDIDIINYSKMR